MNLGFFQSLPKAPSISLRFAHTREVEREFGPYSSVLRTIVVYPRNATNSEPDIVLEPLGYDAFNKALEAMG
ncbi:hypothetical protein ACFSQT_34860 [Mesorhizobium calcicola]|uniref:Uncharacterized protein n=1 Tax=Mesorhizobium calcicola TaxID=1300310 RepID=A0ABW4WR61_9HYPH